MLGLKRFERDSGVGQGQTLLILGLGLLASSYKLILLLVVGCAGFGGTWERLHSELKPAATSSWLGTIWWALDESRSQLPLVLSLWLIT